jgi:hypothetical protein
MAGTFISPAGPGHLADHREPVPDAVAHPPVGRKFDDAVEVRDRCPTDLVWVARGIRQPENSVNDLWTDTNSA